MFRLRSDFRQVGIIENDTSTISNCSNDSQEDTQFYPLPIEEKQPAASRRAQVRKDFHKPFLGAPVVGN